MEILGVFYRDVTLKHHLSAIYLVSIVLYLYSLYTYIYEYCKTLDLNLLFQRKVGGGYFMAPQRPNKSFEERKNGLWPTTKSAVSIYIIKHFRVNHILSIYQINKLISLKIWLFEFRSPPPIFCKKSINFY